MLILSLLVHAALALDITDYQQVLTAHVDTQGRVDYAALRSSAQLDAFTQALADAEEPTSTPEKMAFWINAYNALTLNLIADNYPLSSIRELDGGDPWNVRMFTVAGQSVTLNHIEHQILRPMGDARVHAAVNCASIGCPPLQGSPFNGATLDQQLHDASRQWIQSNGIAIDQQDGSVQLSKIFDWYGDDFIQSDETKEQAATRFAAEYIPEHANFLLQGTYTTSYLSYDWGLNAQTP